MKRLPSPYLLIVAAICGIAATYCTLGLLVRVDDAEEFSVIRLDAVLLTILWPAAFALFLRALGVNRWRTALWTVLVLFIAWFTGAGRMQMEYSRGGNDHQSWLGY